MGAKFWLVYCRFSLRQLQTEMTRRKNLVQFSSVQFKIVSMRSIFNLKKKKKKIKIIRASPRLSKVSGTLPLKGFQCSSDWRRPSLVLLKVARLSSFWRRLVYRLLFRRHSASGDRRCGIYVLGFAFQPSQRLWRLWGLLWPATPQDSNKPYGFCGRKINPLAATACKISGQYICWSYS